MSDDGGDGMYYMGLEEGRASAREEMQELIDRAKALVDMLDDAEVNHGGLIGVKTLRCKNELRLELARWIK